MYIFVFVLIIFIFVKLYNYFNKNKFRKYVSNQDNKSSLNNLNL